MEEPTFAFGWHGEFVDDRFRWRGCTSATACSFQDREAAAGSVISVALAGQTVVDGPDGPRVVQVQKIELRPNAQQRP
jgi:hypothetical protein